MEKDTKIRYSGIELLKIIAIICIVISHVSQTMADSNIMTLNNYKDCIINLQSTTNSVENFILSLTRYIGFLGNLIFITCSIWFFIDDNKVKLSKIIQIILDVWIISILLFVIHYALRIGVTAKDIKLAVFPNLYLTNWYIVAYLMIYAIHPYLNIIVRSISKKELLIINIVGITIYYVFCFARPESYFNTSFMVFIIMYFIVSYIKLYGIKIWVKRTFILGILGNIFLVAMTNFLGMKISFFTNKRLYWANNNNPFLLSIALSAFMYFKDKRFINKKINYISSVTLYIYVIHENIFFRTYARPKLLGMLYQTLNYHYALLMVVLFAFVLIITTMALAVIYKNTIKKITIKFSNKLNNVILNCYDRIELK